MARPLRIEFPGALYHLTSRGNARQCIFHCDADRWSFLELLALVCERFGWLCHAYCLMDNHYHLLVETVNPTLSKGMKYLNGGYAQRHNRRHDRVGHLFQGRFKGILVDSNCYSKELARYIVLNPVRAGMVGSADEWPWSSYRATAGIESGHACLTTDWVLSGFSSQRRTACKKYREFVREGKKSPSPWKSLKSHVYLGSDQFLDDMLSRIDSQQSLDDIPKSQTRLPRKPLEYYQMEYGDQKNAMAMAYLSGHYTLAEVGRQFGVSYSTVSRAVKFYENDVKCKV